jgi:hypothetical protein
LTRLYPGIDPVVLLSSRLILVFYRLALAAKGFRLIAKAHSCYIAAGKIKKLCKIPAF